MVKLKSHAPQEWGAGAMLPKNRDQQKSCSPKVGSSNYAPQE